MTIKEADRKILDYLAQARTLAAQIEHLYRGAMDLASHVHEDFSDGECGSLDAEAHDLRYALDDEINRFNEFLNPSQDD